MSGNNDSTFEEGLLYALEKIGKSGLNIKNEQKLAVRSLVIDNRDVLAVLPTGFGKSLIFQLLPFVYDYMNGNRSKSSVIVISPLNGLIRDQIEKLKPLIDVGVLQHDFAALDKESVGDDSTIDDVMNSQLIFAHPEVFVNNKMVSVQLFLVIGKIIYIILVSSFH